MGKEKKAIQRTVAGEEIPPQINKTCFQARMYTIKLEEPNQKTNVTIKRL